MVHRDTSITGWITNETHGEYAVTMKAIIETTCKLPPDPQAAFFAAPIEAPFYSGGGFPGKANPLEAALGTRRNIYGYPLSAGSKRHGPRRKFVERQLCSAKECVCLAGLGGKCVACGTME